jgi:GDPmannose 4,6-dehydratase
MWLMLQQDSPDDFVIATGEARSVRELVQEAFGILDLDWKEHVVLDDRYHRPTEVDNLRGDASKAKRILKWEPRVHFTELVRMMVETDLELARQERTLNDAGHVVAARGAAAR